MARRSDLSTLREMITRLGADRFVDLVDEALSLDFSAMRSNPSPRADVTRGARLYKNFTGHAVSRSANVDLPPLPKVGLAIGPCLGIMYQTVRDAKQENYLHRFRKGSQPLVVVSADGESVLLLGGAFTFTERGFEDR